MHLGAHSPRGRGSMRRAYRPLDALVVLTDRDVRRYGRMLDGQVKLVRIPNTVRPNVDGASPLKGTTILAAGRLVPQKGFGMLIKAFARVAESRPEWRLLIC